MKYLKLSLLILVLVFVYLCYYGFGEPLLTSAFDDAKDSEPVSKISKTIDYVLYGSTAVDSDVSMELQKKYFKTQVKKHPIISSQQWRKQFPEDSDNKQFLENARNHLMYGLFVSDEKIHEYRENIPESFKLEYETEKKKVIEKKEREKRSWIPFLFVLFMIFVCAFISFFILCGKMAGLFESIVDSINKKRNKIVGNNRTGYVNANNYHSSENAQIFTMAYLANISAKITIKLLTKLVDFFKK